MLVNRSNLNLSRPQTTGVTTRQKPVGYGVRSTHSASSSSLPTSSRLPGTHGTKPNNVSIYGASLLPSGIASVSSTGKLTSISDQSAKPPRPIPNSLTQNSIMTSGSSSNGSISTSFLQFNQRPPTAPSRILIPSNRGRSITFDDKTYISILKSDILRLQRKIEEFQNSDNGDSSAKSDNSTSSDSNMSTAEEIENLLKDYEFRAGCKTQNQMTKSSLVDILFERMHSLEKSVLETVCDENESYLKVFDSNLSRIGLFFGMIEKILSMSEKLKSYTTNKTINSNLTSKPLITLEMNSHKGSTGDKMKSKQGSKDSPSNLTKSKEDNKRLKKQVNDLKRKLQKYKETEKNLESKIQELTEKQLPPSTTLNDNPLSYLVEEYKTRNSDLETTVKSLQSLNDKIQKESDSKSQTLKANVNKLKEEIVSLEKNAHTSSMEIDALKRKISNLEHGKENSTMDLMSQLKEIESAHKININKLEESYMNQIQSINKENKMLQQNVNELKMNYTEATDRESRIRLEMEDLQKQFLKTKKELEMKNSNTMDKSKVLIQKEKELEELREHFNKKSKSQEQDISQYKSKICELEGEISTLQSTIRSLKLATSTDSHELKRLQDVEARYKKLLQEMNSIASMRAQDEESLKRLAQMQTYLEKMEQEYKELQKECESEKRKNELLRNCDTLYQEAMQELRDERQKRKELEEKAVNSDRVRRLNEKILNAEQIIREKNEQIHKMEKKEHVLQESVVRMRKEIKRLLDDIESRDQRIERLEETKKDLLEKQSKPSSNTDLSSIMNQMRQADQSLNDALITEVKTVRATFQEKLRLATEEIERIKQFHRKQLMEMQEFVSKERQLHEKKLQELRDRCDLLTKAVEMLQTKYGS